MRKLAMALSIASSSVTAEANQIRYSYHHGHPIYLKGEGGSVQEYDNIEIWTDGLPARQFRVIGSIVDERTDRIWSGTVFLSHRIAYLARRMGGDAIVASRQLVWTSDVEFGGLRYAAGFIGAPTAAFKTNTIRTKMIVIRY